MRKCLNAAFSFPQDVYSFLQDTSYESAKDVQVFQDAVLSPTRRGGFGLDGQDAADLAFTDTTYKAPAPKDVGETEEGFSGLTPCRSDAQRRTRGTIVRIRSEEDHASKWI